MSKFKVGDLVFFQSHYRPRNSNLAFVTSTELHVYGLVRYELETMDGDTVSRWSDEVYRATQTQLVRELSEQLKRELLANYAETV
jgi:hypothetical protein